MRIARNAASLSPVNVGDHVCWLVPADDDFRRTAYDYLHDGAKIGDKLMVLGPLSTAWPEWRPPQALLIDPAAGGSAWGTDSLVSLVRQEAETAGRQGYRALRVLARMDHVWPAGATPQQIADQELKLDALVGSGTAAAVVCAYPGRAFLPHILEQAATLHPHFAGSPARAPSFQLFSSGEGRWTVSGVVDADGVDAFRTAVTELLRTTATLRLLCHGLDMMDVAGMQTLAEAARAFPGRRILVEGCNSTVRKCWELLGFNDPTIAVELAP
ncbi:MEDS domain-containing protein [Actinacidiphila paucisporea]|uniref:STAS domain-containing protein n=1 Tax=Actinacidiphila paucisporea TaxID=310782 RepID=A0A1M7M7R3_9ACTN|nr:MEDS domain-containing protein [Actinacidiphila paucisporea]SHM86300.1 STAS domain-containing protein [Actinacidiphila paucisporea]